MLIFLVGCHVTNHRIIIGTGTTIGFDVSESLTGGGTPQATLAYKRAEIIIAPAFTNENIPDILMDFRLHTALFSTNGGVYSHIEIGKHAIQSK